MTQIRWSLEAADDFEHIVEYIRLKNPPAADRVTQIINDNIYSLAKFPHSGKPGREKGTRELVLARLPFIVVYRIREEFVQIVRILHGAQRWP